MNIEEIKTVSSKILNAYIPNNIELTENNNIITLTNYTATASAILSFNNIIVSITDTIIPIATIYKSL
jgi:hypothetical protein